VNLEEYRTLFIVATLGCALVAVSPLVAVVLPQVGSEEFSEFWLLSPDHMVEGYPFNVGESEEYGVFVGVGNHMGGSEYYRVYVKFGGGAESLPDIDGGVPSVLSPFYEYQFFVCDGEVWESPVTFGFEDVVVDGDVLVVGDVTVNGVSFPVDASAVWDSEDSGYFYVLFFELWRYDVEYGDFRFDDRYVGLQLSIMPQ